MGDNIKHDEAILIEQMFALMEKFEEDWQKLAKDERRTPAQSCEVLFPALFLVVAYCGALPGEEVPLMDLEATREFMESSLEHPKKS
jgi:hypothetical protein